MSKRPAHVFRHVRWADDIPPEFEGCVLSPGPWVLVYWDGQWHEWGGGYNAPETAFTAGEWLAGEGNVVLHERMAA